MTHAAEPSGAAWTPIDKDAAALPVEPNLLDYEATCTAFSWEAARAELLPKPRAAGMNIADLAIDRHAEGPLAKRTALRWIAKDGRTKTFTFSDLREATNRFAGALQRLGVAPGERVFALTGRIPEHAIAALGVLKNRSVFCPLFSAFGPQPLAQRLERGNAKVLVTSYVLYQRRVAALRAELPELRHVVITDIDDHVGSGVWSFSKLLAESNPEFAVPFTQPQDMALLHFTSGTTGTPKGAIHVHEAALMHYVTGKYALDLHEDDVFWCTADPGWVTGTSYGMLAPLLHGVTNIVDEGDFDADRWYRILQDERISVWYTAPTAVRMLMRSPIEPRNAYDLRRLRFVASVGEPLNPVGVVWGAQSLGLPIHDNWWQTETGGIIIANYSAMQIRPGSMGRPLPGVDAAVLHRRDDGSVEFVHDGEEGELAVRAGWPSMFRAYLHDDERYAKCFAGGWYFSGDLAKRDTDGYFTFVGRADDIIKTAGHMVGPFEVESVLMEHPAVAEAGVIGKPDPLIGEVVKAFVVLRPGYEASDNLKLDVIGFARTRLGSVIAPKELEFKDSIPRTRSGKIMRRVLRARELGLPVGRRLDAGEYMTQIAQAPAAHGIELLARMIRVRRFEERSAEAYAEQKIRGFLHLYIGEEAVATGIVPLLEPEDTLLTTYREHAHALLRGVSANAIMAEMYGKQEGCSGGRGGSMHLYDAKTRFYGGNGIVGGGLPLALGFALADKMRRRASVTCCFFGEGAVAEGEFHESMNLAALWKLPVLYVCENNLYAMGTRIDLSESVTDVRKKAASYGVASASVNGMDVELVEEAAKRAIAHVRDGNGPYFLECRTYRFHGHSTADPQFYRSKAEVAAWKKHDPIDTFSARLRERGELCDADLAAIEHEAAQEMDAAAAFAEAGTAEPPDRLTHYVYKESGP